MNKEAEYNLDLQLRRALTSTEIETIKEDFAKDIPIEVIEEHIQVVHGIDAYGAANLRKDLVAIHDKHFREPQKEAVAKSPWKALALLAMAAMIVLSSLYIYKMKALAKSPENIFAEYYEPYNYATVKRDASEVSMLTLGVLYNDMNYSEFIVHFEKEFKNSQDLSSDLILAAGIAYLETNEPYKAIFQFEKIITNGDFNYEESAYWYKALALIKAEEYIASQSILEQLLANKNSQYSERSRLLIRDLESLDVPSN